MNKSKIKLVGFDFDSTLVYYQNATYSWELISKYLGSEKERKEMYTAYHNGELDYLTWAQKSVDLFKRYGLTKDKFENLFYKEMQLVDGVSQLFNGLESKDIKTAIISGGIRNVYDIFYKKFNIKVDYVNMAHELKFSKIGKLIGETISELDYDGKVTVLKDICDKYDLNMQECAFVGDERNDIPILKKVGLPIAINTKNEDVKSVVKVEISRDISQLLRYL